MTWKRARQRERERKKNCAHPDCFQGKKVWMEALFFSTLSWAVRRLHRAQGCWILSYFCGFWSGSIFFLPFFCLICAADTCAACASTHNTVTHSIGWQCHRTSSNSDLFFPTQRNSVSPLGELAADQKEAENSLSAWQQSLEDFCSLSHTFTKSPASSEILQLMLNRFVGADKPGLFGFVSWLPGEGNIYYKYLSLIFEPSSRAPPAISSCFFYYLLFYWDKNSTFMMRSCNSTSFCPTSAG